MNISDGFIPHFDVSGNGPVGEGSRFIYTRLFSRKADIKRKKEELDLGSYTPEEGSSSTNWWSFRRENSLIQKLHLAFHSSHSSSLQDLPSVI
ncbi:unnamed protein product [Cyprideis torosa]|uniref:Uncharacterized protein n=1 Tax=Cyprideis torosa TaxID=163714 RepID=A0A7R8ZQ77_9CRUS|nr:unnamed protein product [Cyprideis torosa]CAG0891468.1 unnamed protein product [Cyprideis torosa]